nr:10715_t:CDS:10 [Entrophospora candida]
MVKEKLTPVRVGNVELESFDTKTTPLTSFSTSTIITTNNNDYLSQRKPAGISKRRKSFKPTIPKPFKFRTATRPNSTCHDEIQKRSPFVPLAAKVRDFLKKDERSTFGGDKKVNCGRKKPLTIPRSPKLHVSLKSKASSASLFTEEQQNQNNQFKAKTPNQKILECSDLGLPKSQKIEPPVTESLDADSPENNDNTQEKLDQNHDELENTRLFKAQPAPSDTQDTDIRGERYQQIFQERLKGQLEHEKENQFHALPMPNLEPEIIKKPEKPQPTEPVEFLFHTDIRVQGRKLFDEQRKERERNNKSESIPHAHPVKHYLPITIQPSNKRPTKATSPILGEKRRSTSLNSLDKSSDGCDNITNDPNDIHSSSLGTKKLLSTMLSAHYWKHIATGWIESPQLINISTPCFCFKLVSNVLKQHSNYQLHQPIELLQKLKDKAIIKSDALTVAKIFSNTFTLHDANFVPVWELHHLIPGNSGEGSARDGFEIHKDNIVVVAGAAYEFNRILSLSHDPSEEEVNRARTHIGFGDGDTKIQNVPSFGDLYKGKHLRRCPLKYNLELHDNKHIQKQQCNGDILIDQPNPLYSNEQFAAINSAEINSAAAIKFSTEILIPEKISNNDNINELNRVIFSFRS